MAGRTKTKGTVQEPQAIVPPEVRNRDILAALKDAGGEMTWKTLVEEMWNRSGDSAWSLLVRIGSLSPTFIKGSDNPCNTVADASNDRENPLLRLTERAIYFLENP